MTDHSLLRSIPKVDELLRHPALIAAAVPAQLLTDSIREELDALRRDILDGRRDKLPEDDALCAAILARAESGRRCALRGVINATGVVLHTNLGRAPLAAEAVAAVRAAAEGYSTLEYDLDKGGRGSRTTHVEPLLCRLTGAEAAVVVNNNAAAVLLILSALGKGREAVVSRGELVEIGGSFRVPDIMESCGCLLREVGTTNKTHLTDYARAMGENTFALMKVHTSNFRIQGFTHSVPLRELAELAHAHDLPLIEDLGSGALVDPDLYGAYDEPFAEESLRAGADIVSFSGDKLLGGPQAGIIVGKKSYIDQLRAHPLMRAMRVDKMTLAALEATLRLYLRRDAAAVPTVAMLTAPEEQLQTRAQRLSRLLTAAGIPHHLQPMAGKVGGGSAPTLELPGWGVAIDVDRPPQWLEARLRAAAEPVIARVADDCVLLDVRTIFDRQFDAVVAALKEALA